MDDNGDILEIRDGQQHQDEPPAWTHPAFADAVRAADLTRTQYVQLAAHRRAQRMQQQNHQQNYQQVQQQGHPQSQPQNHQQSQPHQHAQQQGHARSQPQGYQRSQSQSYSHGHPQSYSHGHPQNYSHGHPQSYSHGHPHSHPQSNAQNQQEEELRQQQQQYYRLKKLQELQTQQYHHRASPATGPHSSEHSNQTFIRAQSGQPQSAATAQPPRPSTESPIADLREQYVRPSDLGPSMSHYGVNSLRRTSVPLSLQPQQPASSQATTGDDNVQIPAQSQSQIVHTRPPSNPRSSTPGQSDQGRNLATSNPAPSVAPSSRPDLTTERRQEVPHAKAIEAETPAQISRPVDKHNLTRTTGKLPVENTINTMSPPRGDPYNSASRTTIGLHPKSQAQTKAKESSTPNKPSPQEPARSAPSSASHPVTNATTSSTSAPPRSAAHTPENSTTSTHRVSSTQSASNDLNHPGHSSSTIPATKSATSPQSRPSSTPTSLATSLRHSSEPNQFKRSKPMDLKASDTPARDSSVQSNPGQEARTQAQPSPSIRPQAPLQRSVSVPQQTHGAMQPPPRPAKTPAPAVHRPAVSGSHRNPPANIQVTHDRDLDISRGSQSAGVTSQSAGVTSQSAGVTSQSAGVTSRPASSTTLSNAPTKPIPQVISNALPSIKRKWTQYVPPQESPAQNSTSTQRDMSPNKMPRLNGFTQGSSLKAIENDHPSKKIHQGMPPKKRNRFPAQSQTRHRDDLVQPIDSNKTDPRDAYNPATIARDVLIVAAKHPTERRLNEHLAVIMKNFPHIDSSKDLATLRWDLIDPVLPPDELHHPHRPPPASVPAPVPVPAPAPGPHIHVTQIRAPPHYPPQIHAPQMHGPPITAPQIRAPRPPQYFPRPFYYSPYPRHYPLHSVPGQIQPPPANWFTSQFPPSSTPLQKAQVKSTPIPKQNTPQQSTPKKAEGAGFVKATPPPQPKVVVESPRPKKALESPRAQKHPSLQVVINSPRKMDQPKQRGRPKKDVKSDKGADASNKKPLPGFPVFNCLWANCQAELHNLSNLQDHVVKKHVPHNFLCGWKECDNQTPMAAADLWEHVQDSHIKPIRWSQGDGPAVPVIGENIDLHISAGLHRDTGA